MSSTTMTLTAEPQNGAVLISITVTGLPGDYDPDLYTLTRTDANGVADVRRLEGQSISGGTLLIRDYEPALSGTVSYTSWTGLSGDASVSQSITLNYESDVLSLAVLPQYRTFPYMVTDFTSRQEFRSTVHRVVGRGDPLVVIGPIGTREGRLDILAGDLEQAQAVADLYGRGEVVLLRFAQSAGRDLYHVARSVAIEPWEPGTALWAVTVEYIEVARPTGPLLGSLGWTYADIAGSTYQQVKADYLTYGDLVVGDV